MDYDEAIKYLYSFESKGIKLGLERVEKLLLEIGNPQKDIKAIHVAGTNGKGSVSAMVSAILQAAGYKVGLYTSPHLVDFEERIRVNDKNITKKDVVKLIEKIKPFADEATFFEFVTAMAFAYFKDKKVDYAVVEVGMGGRLDATNVCNPKVSIITNISLEHVQWLGKTIKEIAGEKAGIIKEEVPVVTAAEGEALDVIREVCAQKNCKLVIAKESDYHSNLDGSFQRINIGVAVETARLLEIKDDTVRKGLAKVEWPGRFQFLKYNVILDSCHNPAAAKALREALEKMQYGKLILVIGMLNDKDYAAVIKELEPLAAKVVLCQPKTHRALQAEILAKEVTKDKEIIEDVVLAYKHALELANKSDLILVTGSNYVIGEVLARKDL